MPMEVFKDLVRFNRYKSVESFNNATDVTSSTISIVKLDENVMDIYLGRIQLTHSNFPEVNIELRNLIDSLDIKLNNLKIEFNSKTSSMDEKYNKELSNYISDFESGLNDLINHTNNLSKEILDIKLDIAGKTYEMKIDPRNEEVYRLAAREINSRLTRAQRSHVDGFAMQDYLAVVAVDLMISNIRLERKNDVEESDLAALKELSQKLGRHLENQR